MVKFFLDTYALVEIVHGNPQYAKYIDAECHTTLLNLYELYFQLLRDMSKDIAEAMFKKFLPLKVELKEEYIPPASEFKLRLKKNNISYVDALGYAIALENGWKFLTGDKEFEGLAHVEFVK